MDYTLAKALFQLRKQINEKWTRRSKNSDGWIGDAAHRNRKSDHNPNSRGVVTALDITHDPANGLDSYLLADLILKTQDPRLEYIISKGRIGSGPRGPEPGKWRKYTGANPHNHHVHFSVHDEYDFYSNDAPWDLTGAVVKFEHEMPPALPMLRKGSKGDDVVKLQQLLKIDDDGDFGKKTERAVMLVQEAKKITVDGIVGPQMWNALGITRL